MTTKYTSLRALCGMVLALLLTVSCHKPANNLAPINEIRSGDLVLVALPLDYDFDINHPVRDISHDSGEVIYAHVAIAEVVGDSVFVIDATLRHGVDRHPIDTLFATFALKDGSQPRYDIYRLQGSHDVQHYLDLAKQMAGRGYDLDFDLANAEQYCSELVRNSYVTPSGDTLFALRPMDFAASDGSFPPYWTLLFGLIGNPMPQGNPGILPADLTRDPKVQLVCRNWHAE